jgi:HlyD family secretion protein
MKKGVLISAIITVLILSTGVWFFAFRKREKPVLLMTETPGHGYISNSVTATGAVQPVDTVAVGTQVSGTIKKIFVDFNSVVKKGQLLAQLDQSLLMTQIQQITANLRQSESNLTYQQENYRRQSELFNGAVISKSEYETAINQYQSAKDNVSSVAAQLHAAQKNLSYSNIISPIDGTVRARNVSEGQTMAASFNTPTLFTIAKDLTKMQVRASVDEADIGNVTPGERVTFTVDAFPGDVFNGTVEEIRLEPSVSSNVVTYTTIINTPNENRKLKPGMTASIVIYTKEENNAMLIPAKALTFSPDATVLPKNIYEKITPGNGEKNSHPATKHNNIPGQANVNNDSTVSKKAFVWIKNGDSLIQKSILIGLNDDVHVQVLRGLAGNEQIVTGINNSQQQKNVSASTDRSPFMPVRRNQNSTAGNGKRNNQ